MTINGPLKPAPLSPDVFRFVKISCLLILADLSHSWHHRCFIGLTLTGEIVDVEARLYEYDGQVLSEDYELRDTSSNFFQFYCASLQRVKTRILSNIPREYCTFFSQRILFIVQKYIERSRSRYGIKIEMVFYE